MDPSFNGKRSTSIIQKEEAAKKIKSEKDGQNLIANISGGATHTLMGSTGTDKQWKYERIPSNTARKGENEQPSNGFMSTAQRFMEDGLKSVIPVSFAVFINALDACTFGSIFFPKFMGDSVTSIAIELFILSTVIVQLVLIRYSSFQCGLGTAQAENIPFVHAMALGIYNALEATHTVEEMIPTIMVTVCLSTILNGVLFFVVGYFRLGNILHFFPRHVIMGMTAGFGIFLLNCGLESSTGTTFGLDLKALVVSMTPSQRKYQLLIVFLFELLLRAVEQLKFNQLVVPCLMFLLPVVFYIVLYLMDETTQRARETGWLFPQTATVQWWETWSLFDFSRVEWFVVLEQWMTMSSLAVFTLILVPIRIPSLSIITGDEVNFDEEFKAQGLANILSGLVGAVHNYLSYSNSIFFFYTGGRGKWSQGAVATLTMILFFVGPTIISYVPRCIAGVIMVHLGVDLLIGSLVTSRSILDNTEYVSVVIIAAVVSFLGFVPGVIAGIASTCATYVIQSSRQSSIRSIFSGETARSNTSWSSHQRDCLSKGLSEVSSIYVIQLQGHLFFGNVQHVVEGIENALKLNLSGTSNIDPNDNESSDSSTHQASNDQHIQYRFLILDCSFITGADVNAVAGLLKLKSKMTSQLFQTAIVSGHDSIQRDLDHLDTRTNSLVQVHVLFAGLQDSMEAMFSLQATNIMERSGNSSTHITDREEIGHGEYENREYGIEHKYGTEHSDSESSHQHYESSLCSDVDSSGHKKTTPHHAKKGESKSQLKVDGNGIAGATHEGTGSYGSMDSAGGSHKVTRAGNNGYNDVLTGNGNGNGALLLVSELSKSMDREYYSDVNTALQAVEERIIKATPVSVEGPRKSFTKRRSFSLESTTELRREDMTESSSSSSSTTTINQQRQSYEEGIAAAVIHINTDNDNTDMNTNFNSRKEGLDGKKTSSSSNLLFEDYSPIAGTGHKSNSSSRSESRSNSRSGSDVGMTIDGLAMSMSMSMGAPIPLHPRVSSLMRDPSEGRRSTSPKTSDSTSSSPLLDPTPTLLQQLSDRPRLDSTSTSSTTLMDNGRMVMFNVTTPPPLPTEHLTPTQKSLKMAISNMLFDLSPQWTMADSPALKRLSARLMQGVTTVKKGHILWEADGEALQMGLVVSGRLKAVLRSKSKRQSYDEARTLQVILPGNVFGELGLLSRGVHSRTIIASTDSKLVLLHRNVLDEIEETDKALLCCLQHLALRTAAVRSHELMLFNAGSLGP